jgi:hypothetical protein
MVERERFVPQRVSEITDALCRDAAGTGGAVATTELRLLARLVSALYHYEFHDREQAVVTAWDAVSGEDAPTGSDAAATDAAGTDAAAELVTAELTGLLDGANYSPVSMASLDEALERESLIPLRLEVNLDHYDELLIYRRGSHVSHVTVPRWKGLRQEALAVTVDERVVVHTRIKPASWFTEHGIDPARRDVVPGHVSLKQFQNVPRADVEMLLPSTKVRFRLIDSLLIAVPALASGIVVLATKLLPTVGLALLLAGAWLGLRDEEPRIDQGALVALLGGLVALGSFLFRQWNKLKNRRVEYLKTLSENLYFRTLATGRGVLHTLFASAEEQETIEVLLAYGMLTAAGTGLTPSELDERVEAWLRDDGHGDIDFEIDDALDKLRRLDLVEVGPGPVVRARPPVEALERLDRRWDDLFRIPRRPETPDGVTDPDATVPDGTGAAGDGDGPDTAPLIRLRRVVDRFRAVLGDRRLEREP